MTWHNIFTPTIMRSMLLKSLLLLFFFSSCEERNNNGDKLERNKSDSGIITDKSPKGTTPIDELLEGYLELKDALITDHSVKASEAGKKISREVDRVSLAAMDDNGRKTYGSLKKDIEEHALHILANRSNIAHQREHFEKLTNDMLELVRVTGTAQTLYLLYCPKYNNNEGGSWISTTRDAMNPYFGGKRTDCSELKEEIKSDSSITV